MKILLVNKFHFQKGGAETYYFTLAESLKAKGHEVIFFSMKHDKNLKCEQEKYFVENREYNGKTSILDKIKAFNNFVYSKEAYNNMNKLLDDEHPDLVILNNIHRQLTTSIVDAIKEHNIKIVWIVHDLITLCPNYQMLNGNHEICEKCCNGNYFNCVKNNCVKASKLKSFLAYREATYNKKHKTYNNIDLFITPSKFYREKMIQYGFDTNKVIYMKNPLPVDTKYELSTEIKEYILFFGRLSKEKGVKTLIESMKNVDYKLVILGTGPIGDELKKFIIDNNLESKVSMLGFKSGEELNTYIREAKVVVLPSEWYENGPYSAMEAMALGKPLIVSNNGGLPELVEDNVNGYIFNKKDELSDKLNKIINLSNEEYKMMCEFSLSKAKEWFNPLNYVDELLLK